MHGTIEETYHDENSLTMRPMIDELDSVSLVGGWSFTLPMPTKLL